MAYIIDRQRALRACDVVLIHPVRRGRNLSQVLLKDNSSYWTLTRSRTFLSLSKRRSQGIFATV